MKTRSLLGDLTAVDNLDRGSGGAAGGTEGLELLQDLLALLNLSKDGVLAIQPRGVLEANEELGAVGVGSSVGHRQDGSTVGNLEVLTGNIQFKISKWMLIIIKKKGSKQQHSSTVHLKILFIQEEAQML